MNSKLFEGKRIFINNSIDFSIVSNLKTLITSNGGIVVEDRSKKSGFDASQPRFDLKTTTHVVSAGIDFPEYSKCWEPNGEEERVAIDQDGNSNGNENGSGSGSGSGSQQKRPAVVSIQWVRRSLILGILDTELGHSAHPDAIFSGVVACTANLSNDSNLQIRAMIEAWGGRSIQSLTKEVTHLLTDARKGSKYKSLYQQWQKKMAIRTSDTSNLNHSSHQFALGNEDPSLKEWEVDLPIVLLPNWVEHSYKNHITLDPLPFKFDLDDQTQEPVVMNDSSILASILHQESSRSPVRNDRDHSNRGGISTSEKIKWSKVNLTKEIFKPQNTNTKDTLRGKSILLSHPFVKSAREETLNAFKSQILEAGAKVVTIADNYDDDLKVEQSVRDADIVISNHRDDKECRLAYKDGSKIIGSFEWLVSVLKYGRLTSPFDNLLHFPSPSKHCEDLKDAYVTISKYEGTARIYLKKLIERLGGKFTADLTKNNTHVVTPVRAGEKAVAGANWGLEIVTHHWLESCFAAWKRVPERASPTFLNFDLSAKIMNSTVGNTPLDKDLITAWFNDLEEREEYERTLQNDQRIDGMKTPSSSNVGKGKGKEIQSERMLASDDYVMVDEKENKEVEKNGNLDEDYDMVDGTRDIGDGSRSLDPITPKIIRKSKTGASAVAVASSSAAPSKTNKKRSSSPVRKSRNEEADEEMGELDEEVPEPPPSKKKKVSKKVVKEEVGDLSAELSKSTISKKSLTKKTSKSSAMDVDKEEAADEEEEEATQPRPIYYVTTGYEIKPKEKQALKDLGATLQENFTKDTNLVIAGKLSRTEKFLRALAKGDVEIVDGKWVQDVTKSKQMKKFSDYHLLDKEGETKFNAGLDASRLKSHRFSLQKSIERAHRKPASLLSGHTFYFSPSFETDSSSKIMRAVVLQAGGKCPTKINWNLIMKDPSNHHLIGIEKDQKVWRKELGNRSDGDGINVWKKELISAGVLRMKMDWVSDIIDTIEVE